MLSWYLVWSSQGAGVQTFWVTASSAVQFLGPFDVFDALHLCYLTRLPRHCSGSVMQGCCFSNLCSVHRESGICMWIAFLLPLMWGTIACCMSARWEKSISFFLFFSSFMSVSFEAEKNKTKGGTEALLLHCCSKNWLSVEKRVKKYVWLRCVNSVWARCSAGRVGIDLLVAL